MFKKEYERFYIVLFLKSGGYLTESEYYLDEFMSGLGSHKKMIEPF